MKRTVLLALVLSVAATGALAETYKWRDASGRIQYGDRPPPGVKAEPVSRATGGTIGGPAGAAGTASAAEGAAPTGPKTTAEREQDFRKRRIEAEEKEKKAQQMAEQQRQREENCRNARQALAVYESGQRVARLDSKGERYYLEDDQIAREKANAQKAVQEWCK